MADPFSIAKDYLMGLSVPSSSSRDGKIADLPLNIFATRSLILSVWADVLGEEIWFVSRDAQVQVLQRRGMPREKIFTARELIDLLKLFRVNKEKALLVCEAKKLFGGSLRTDD